MKPKFILFLLFAAGACFTEMQAQAKQVFTIIDDLVSFVPGNGIIQISSDPKITDLIGTFSSEITATKKDYVSTKGFRIQVFMSNNSKTAKQEISDKGSLIKGVFPETAIYTGYAAPNWKLLVGDFRSKEEATVFKQKLLKSVPGLGKEMYIVPDKVNISVQKSD